MARVEFKHENIRAHGFPYACVMCGGDDSPRLREMSLSRRTSRVALGCLFFMGPFFWLIGAILLLVSKLFSSKKMSMPICDCCTEGGRQLGKRDGIVGAIGAAVMFSTIYYGNSFTPFFFNLSVAAGALIVFAALVEWAWLSNQFQFRVLKSDQDRVILELPNDDYPAIYQRHLDTVSLYGAVESLGARVSDEELQA